MITDPNTGIEYEPMPDELCAEKAEMLWEMFQHYNWHGVTKEEAIEQFKNDYRHEPLRKILEAQALNRREKEVSKLLTLEQAIEYTRTMVIFPHEPEHDPQESLCKFFEDWLTEKKWRWSYGRSPDSDGTYKVILYKDDMPDAEVFKDELLPKALLAAYEFASTRP